jgi:hypothetical protein
MSWIRSKITYANIVATLALFLALGGTSYAVVQLARDSVGSPQIRKDAVGSSELRRSAVTSRSLRNRSVGLGDISLSARTALRGAKGDPGPQGAQGPAGVTYRASVNSGGGTVKGNAVTASHQGGSGLYTIAFDRDVSACVATATLAAVQNGPTLEEPPAGRITVGTDGPRVSVRTFAVDGAVQDLPFNIIVAC